jgi:hypothetical protein
LSIAIHGRSCWRAHTPAVRIPVTVRWIFVLATAWKAAGMLHTTLVYLGLSDDEIRSLSRAWRTSGVAHLPRLPACVCRLRDGGGRDGALSPPGRLLA